MNFLHRQSTNEKIDPKFRIPRIWSNDELNKFKHVWEGKVINVSAREDADKQGGHYRSYFPNASEYWISNYEQIDTTKVAHVDGILRIDLEQDLQSEQQHSFDIVFNHTTLEHVYDCRRAFLNLCGLSKDVVIVVVPYIQQIHGDGYYDFWRFTPHTMKRLYEENGLRLRYCAANGADRASIYLFCIGYRNNAWDSIIPERFDLKIAQGKALYADNYTNVIGGNVIR